MQPHLHAHLQLIAGGGYGEVRPGTEGGLLLERQLHVQRMWLFARAVYDRARLDGGALQRDEAQRPGRVLAAEPKEVASLR